MSIPFKKMHGAGNDFIIIRYQDYPFPEKFSELATQVCHRNFGVGADGLMVVCPSNLDSASVRMVYYNSDGSLASMCGNGIRCFTKFVFDEGIVSSKCFNIETPAGVLTVDVKTANEKVNLVKVNMGKMILEPQAIPVVYDGENFIEKKLEIEGKVFEASTVLMGVPHTVIFTEELNDDTVKYYGPIIEKLDIFPEKTNVNFAKIIDGNNIWVKTWERGAGFTLACGTGVTSVCGIAHYLGRVNDEINVIIDGGRLLITINEDGSMEMEGPAEDICKGVFFVV
ncbi:diaminopimelate epimerase [Alkaliphilus peptidifermentans]|uniref:Diaminopimelate epimerase n=1 Tax=Alkaliphilus peptidifermentans DSM 18978 TaxID=1120976 RepID=A0A1G5JB04_9FIRM|nr:diaminopimelate epimerase [Alkaliphilus peptidifermentans]SCY85563.1 diaminopimelate epimerase [Alkaliphilus peptidifermentans DSM 18978]